MNFFSMIEQFADIKPLDSGFFQHIALLLN